MRIYEKEWNINRMYCIIRKRARNQSIKGFNEVKCDG